MGTNMLRFGHWLKHKTLPHVAVITGEENPSAQFLVQREHFHAIYFKTANKLVAFEHFLKTNNLRANEVAFVFDDVLDLGMAEKCGLRFLINHHASPLFQNYTVKNQIADYITSTDNHAVREVSELILGVNGVFDDAIKKRSHFDEVYQKYLRERNQVAIRKFYLKDGKVEEMSA
jgi:3-deoxy-D-manno-octulosonate 8-phosphate phosphatase (KDO 8-P phosphatase)